MSGYKHPEARREANRMIDRHDGEAGALVKATLDRKLSDGDLEAALHLDQVRREIERSEANEDR